MADKKNFIYYTSSEDKFIQKRLEELSNMEKNEVTKRLEHNKMVEEITANVMKSLSKSIESIVSEQVGKLGKPTSINRNYPDLKSSPIDSDDYVYYDFNDDLTKGQVSVDETISDIDKKLELAMPLLEKYGMSFERTYNKEKGGYDLIVVDKNGNKFALETKAQKKPTHPTSWYSLVDNYIDNRSKLKDIMGINLFSGAGGLQNAYNPLVNDASPDFTNYKVKSNIGYFMDKLNMQRTWLANQTSVSRGTIVANLEEANGLSLLNAYKISKVLGVPMEELFVFTDEDDEKTDTIE